MARYGNENAAAGGRSRDTASRDRSYGGGGGPRGGGMSSGDQRHRNRLAEIARVGAITNRSTAPSGNTGISPAGRVSSAALGMSRDYRNVGNSLGENFGNRLAGLFGFNEQRPSLAAAAARVDETTPGMVTDRRAGWGFDPAAMIGSIGGAALGIPFAGFATDYLSKLAGRPMEIGMGPSVFGGGPSYGGMGPDGRVGNTDGKDLAYGLQQRPKAPLPSRLGGGHLVTPEGLLYKPQYTQPKFIGDMTPGLQPYGLQTKPWRYYG